MAVDATFEEIMARGVELHDLAVQGKAGASQEALKWLEQALQMQPDHPLAQAYYGSALALVGRDSIDPQERVVKALRGLKILDRTAAAYGDLVPVRILRGYVAYRLPEEYFYRTQTAIEDFSFLIQRYEQDSTIFSEEFCRQLLSDLAKAYRTVGKEEQALKVEEKLARLGRGRDSESGKADGMNGDGPAPDAGALEAAKRTAFIEQGLRLLELAETGDKAAAEKAYKLAEELRSLFPDDPLAAALYGSSHSLMGRYASEGSTMFARAIEGIEIIEGAVRRDPENIVLRKIRAQHSYRLPEAFFHRTAAAISDFQYLAAQFRAGSKEIDSGEYQRILYQLGDCYLRLGMSADAREVWDELLALNPNSPYAEAARKQLHQHLPQELLSPPEMEDIDDLLDWAIALFRQGLKGSPAAAAAAKVCLEKVHQLRPEDPAVEAYYGSALALTGRYSSNSSDMFQNAVQGLALVNSALRDWPKSPEIRLLRGYLCFSLPEPLFHLTDRAVEDFEWVREWYLTTSRRKREKVLSRAEFLDLLFSLQTAYRRLGQNEKADALTLEIETERARPAEN